MRLVEVQKARPMSDTSEKLKRAAGVLRKRKSTPQQRSAAARAMVKDHAKEAGRLGGRARAKKMNAKRRSEIAAMGGRAAAAKMKHRWAIIRRVEAAEEEARREVISEAAEKS